MVRNLADIIKAKAAKEPKVSRVSKFEETLHKFSSDSDEDSKADDSSGDDVAEMFAQPSSSKSSTPIKTKNTPLKTRMTSLKTTPKSSPNKVSKAAQAVKRKRATDAGFKSDDDVLFHDAELVPVPKNYFSSSYKETGKSKATPKKWGTSTERVKMSIVRQTPNGKYMAHNFGAAALSMTIGDLIYNLPDTWNTRRSDHYYYQGEMIHDKSTTTLASLGVKDGDRIEAVARGLSG